MRLEGRKNQQKIKNPTGASLPNKNSCGSFPSKKTNRRFLFENENEKRSQFLTVKKGFNMAKKACFAFERLKKPRKNKKSYGSSPSKQKILRELPFRNKKSCGSSPSEQKNRRFCFENENEQRGQCFQS